MLVYKSILMYDKLYMLKPFFDNPSHEYHIREFARVLKVNPMTARKYLAELEKEGLVESTEKTILYRYKAKLGSSVYREYWFFSLMLILHREEVFALLDGVQMAVVLENKEVGHEILIVGKADSSKLQSAVKIPVTVMSSTAYKERYRIDKDFAERVKMGRIIKGGFV